MKQDAEVNKIYKNRDNNPPGTWTRPSNFHKINVPGYSNILRTKRLNTIVR